MNEEERATLTVAQQARRWVVEVQMDPTRRSAAMRWCEESPEHRAAFDIAEAAIVNHVDPAARNTRRYLRFKKAAIAASIAATFVLLVSTAMLGRNLHKPGSSQEIASTSRKTDDAPLILTTKRGEVREVRLADGSIVTLDTDSRLLVWMRRDRRDVQLDHGRVIFAVAHDRARPFTVTADGGTTTALGTRFGVERRAHCQMNVVLYEGHVAITPPCKPASHTAPEKTQYLQPGQQIRYAPTASPEVIVTPEPAPENDEQWVSGVKSYSDETVETILAEVNLYSDVKLVAGSPEIAAMRLSADLHIRNPQSAAQHIARALGLTVDSSNANRIVLKK